ncbi:hypothetical protein D3C72_719300 [compost metagenome]
MIIGQILINGALYSSHRFPDAHLSQPEVRGMLTGMAYDEQLFSLGRVEIRVHSQNSLERLMAVLLGRDTRQQA